MNYNRLKDPRNNFAENVSANTILIIKTTLQLLLLIPILVGFVLFALFIVIPANIWDWIWN